MISAINQRPPTLELLKCRTSTFLNPTSSSRASKKSHHVFRPKWAHLVKPQLLWHRINRVRQLDAVALAHDVTQSGHIQSDTKNNTPGLRDHFERLSLVTQPGLVDVNPFSFVGKGTAFLRVEVIAVQTPEVLAVALKTPLHTTVVRDTGRRDESDRRYSR